MTQNTRIFSGSISVKTGTTRTKLELSPAELHGGEQGFVRVRMGRRWVEGFFNAEGIAHLVSNLASPLATREEHAPDIPLHTYVSVPIPNKTWSRCITRTALPAPVRLADGRFYVLVHIVGHGNHLVPCSEVKILPPNAARREIFAKLRQQEEVE